MKPVSKQDGRIHLAQQDGLRLAQLSPLPNLPDGSVQVREAPLDDLNLTSPQATDALLPLGVPPNGVIIDDNRARAQTDAASDLPSSPLTQSEWSPPAASLQARQVAEDVFRPELGQTMTLRQILGKRRVTPETEPSAGLSMGQPQSVGLAQDSPVLRTNQDWVSVLNQSNATVAATKVRVVILSNGLISYVDAPGANAFSDGTGMATPEGGSQPGVNVGIVSGQTGGSDVIGGVTYDVKKTGSYGTLYLKSTTGAYVFVPSPSAIAAVAGNTVTESFVLRSGEASGTLTIQVTGLDDPTTLAAPNALSFTDTSAADLFGIELGSLQATDTDTVLTYGIVGGLVGQSDVIQSVTYDIKKIGIHGTLHVKSTTGAYVYVPNQAAVNALNVNQSETFTVTAGSATATLTVNLTGVNDRPMLTDSLLTAVAVNEDAAVPTGAVGTLVSDWTGSNVSDVDSGALKGIAITAVDATHGSLYYSLDGGGSWTLVGAVSSASALLLRADAQTRLYFKPNADENGTFNAVLTLRAWDVTAGVAGTKADLASGALAQAVSLAADTVAITVNPVNDAPVLALVSKSLTNLDIDAPTPQGMTGDRIKDLVASQITDVDVGALQGVAVTSVQGGGTLYYSRNNGASWQSVAGALSESSALLLAADDQTRVYVKPPDGATAETRPATLSYKAWDQTTGSAGNTADTRTGSAFSASVQVVGQTLSQPTPPRVLSFDINRASGTYTTGEAFVISAKLNEIVQAGASITATLSNGQTVELTSTGVSDQLSGTYTVTNAATEAAIDLGVQSYALTAGKTVQDLNGTAMNTFILPTGSSSIEGSKDILIAGPMLAVTAQTSLSTAATGPSYGVGWADINADGRPDLYRNFTAAQDEVNVSTATPSLVGLSYATQTGLAAAGDKPGFNSRLGMPETQKFGRPSMVDFNNDDRMDVALINGFVNVALLQNTGTSSTPEFVDAGWAAGINKTINVGVSSVDGSERLAFADFNGDGVVDVAVQNPWGTGGYISVLTGTGSGKFTFNNALYQLPIVYTSNIAVLGSAGAGSQLWGDFNSDGRLDYLDASRQAGTSTSYQLNLKIVLNSAAGFQADEYVLAQANSTGRKLTSPSFFEQGNQWANRTVISTDTTVGVSAGTKADAKVVIAADYDQDGKLDLFLGGGSLGNGTLLRNAASATHLFEKGAAPIFSAAVTTAAWFDYNMDGWLDLVTSEGVNGIKVYTSKGQSAGVFQGFNTGVSASVTGLQIDNNTALGFNVFDADANGTMDLFVTTGAGSYLFSNQQAQTSYLDVHVLGKVGATPLYGAKVVLTESVTGRTFTQFVQGDTGEGSNQGALRFYGLDASKTYSIDVTYAFDADRTANGFDSVNKVDTGLDLQQVVSRFTREAQGYAPGQAAVTVRVDPSAATNISGNAASFANWSPGVGAISKTQAAPAGSTFVADPFGSIYQGGTGFDTLDLAANPNLVSSNLSLTNRDANGVTGSGSFYYSSGKYQGTTPYWSGTEGDLGSPITSIPGASGGINFSGIDAVVLTSGSDTVADNAGLSIQFGAGNDSLYMGAGLIGQAGLSYDGGADSNAVYLSGLGAATTLTAHASGVVTVRVAGVDVAGFTNFQSFIGSSYADHLDFSGSSVVRSLMGFSSGDTVKGSSGVDNIYIDSTTAAGSTGVKLFNGLGSSSSSDYLYLRATNAYIKITSANTNELTIWTGSAANTSGGALGAAGWTTNGNWFQGSLDDTNRIYPSNYKQAYLDFSNVQHGVTVGLQAYVNSVAQLTGSQGVLVGTTRWDTLRTGSTSFGTGSDTIEGGRGSDTIIIYKGSAPGALNGTTTIKFGAYLDNETFGNLMDTVAATNSTESGFESTKGFDSNLDTSFDLGEDILDFRALFSTNAWRNTEVSFANQASLNQYLKVSSANSSVVQFDRDGVGSSYTFVDLVTLKGHALTDQDLWNLKLAGQLLV